MDVLVADDDPGVRTTLRTLLERRGFNVIEAIDRAQAITKLTGSLVDAASTDLLGRGPTASTCCAERAAEHRWGLSRTTLIDKVKRLAA